MALGTKVFKIHSVSHFAMILSLGGVLGSSGWNKSQIMANIFKIPKILFWSLGSEFCYGIFKF